jgi:hypothetical protein
MHACSFFTSVQSVLLFYRMTLGCIITAPMLSCLATPGQSPVIGQKRTRDFELFVKINVELISVQFQNSAGILTEKINRLEDWYEVLS